MKYLPRMFSHGTEKGLHPASARLPTASNATAHKAGP